MHVFSKSSALKKTSNHRRMFLRERENRKNEKAGSSWKSNPGHLACVTSALPLSYLITGQPPALTILYIYCTSKYQIPFYTSSVSWYNGLRYLFFQSHFSNDLYISQHKLYIKTCIWTCTIESSNWFYRQTYQCFFDAIIIGEKIMSLTDAHT